MIDLLLYSTLACEDAAVIIQRVKKQEDMSSIIKTEIILTVQEATPECPWDAND
tara:strand:+ start:213 stop:374 length:162 start_codon:yes stop_codon:yes gene_type:complete